MSTMTTSDRAWPPVGRALDLTFPDFTVHLSFDSAGTLALAMSGTDGSRYTEQVAFAWRQVDDVVHLLSWQERIGTTVVHALDVVNTTVDCFITTPAHEFRRVRGTVSAPRLTMPEERRP